MESAARPLLLLHDSGELLAQSELFARKHRYRVRRVESWNALRTAVREESPLAVVMVDPYVEAEGGKPAGALRSFLRDFDYVPVVAAMETRTRFRDLLVLARWGVSEVISLDQEALPEALRQRLEAVEGWGLRGALSRSMPRDMTGPATSILFTAADVATEDGSARALARALNVSRRTMTRWSARVALPPPRRLLAWMRLLLAAELLDDWRRKVYQVAHAVGYASDNNLRTALDAFLGRTPKELRRVGAFATVSGAFWEEVRRLRRERRGAANGGHPREKAP